MKFMCLLEIYHHLFTNLYKLGIGMLKPGVTNSAHVHPFEILLTSKISFVFFSSFKVQDWRQLWSFPMSVHGGGKFSVLQLQQNKILKLKAMLRNNSLRSSSPAPSYPLVSPITPSYPGVTTADQQVVAAHKSMSVLTQLSCNNNKVYWTCDSLRISFQLQKIQENKLISVLTTHQQQ